MTFFFKSHTNTLFVVGVTVEFISDSTDVQVNLSLKDADKMGTL